MKTIQNLRSLGLGLLILASSAIFAGGINNPAPIDANALYITYVVNIVPNNQGGVAGCAAFVMVTNDRGQLIAPAKAFRAGVLTYTFRERTTGQGTTGTRVARIVPSWEVKCAASGTYAPDAKTDTFKAGQTYLFHLVQIASDPNKN